MPRRRRRLGGGREGGGVAGSAEQDPAARSERRAGVRKAFAPGADTYRPPYAAAGIATIAVWALYAWTLAPTTQFWDTSEYIATARILGIPHPPGNPLFVVLARAWDLLLEPTGLSVAVRINLFSATMSALAHGFWFLLAHRILSFFSSSGVFRLTGAAAATLLSATAFTVWNQSNVNEKVYTVSLFTIAVLSWLAFRWRDRLGEGKDDNLMLLIIFILALSVGNHHMAFLVAPALVLFILLVHPRTLLNRRLYAAGVVAGVLGLSIHLFLPIRSELAPVINEATPTCDSLDSAMVSIVTMGAVPVDEGDRLYRSRAAERLFGWARDIGCENLSAALQREQYNKPSLRQNPITALIDPEDDPTPRDASLFFAQLANYAQYFDWQWARSVEGPRSWFTDLRLPFTALFIMLGLAGAATQYRRDRDGFTYFASLFLTVSIGLVVYLNFKYGFTLPEELMSRDMRALAARPQLRGIVELTEVRERDYFFIVSFSMWGLWAGIGIATVWQDLTERVRRRVERLRSAKLNAALVTAPVMLFALLPLILNWSWASRRNDYTARDWAYNVLMSVEPYAILFTNGDNDTFPLWYLQEVEGIRRDVTVMVMSYLNTPWYAEQLRELTKPCPPGVDPAQDTTRIVCQRPYIGDGLEIYNRAMVPTDARGVPIDEVPPGRRPPTRSILPLTDEEIVEVSRTPPYLLDQALAYRAGEVETVLPPGAVVTPADAFMASMIHTAIGDRPIYFAMTTRAYEELNLRPYLVRQGVALKLNNGPVEPDSARGIFAVPAGDLALGAPYIDLPRTETLVSDVFVHRGGFPDDWGHWVDSASEQVPFYYAVTHYGLGQVYQHLGYETRAESHYRAGERFLRLSNARQPDS